jgi:hypothetical protein
MGNWTHPCCERCWINEEGGKWEPISGDGEMQILVEVRRPALLKNHEVEQCALCGEPTIFGCYIRRDPATVPFPQEEETPA